MPAITEFDQLNDEQKTKVETLSKEKGTVSLLLGFLLLAPAATLLILNFINKSPNSILLTVIFFSSFLLLHKGIQQRKVQHAPTIQKLIKEHFSKYRPDPNRNSTSK